MGIIPPINYIHFLLNLTFDMEKIKEYLTNPGTIIAFIVFVFGLGTCWATLNSRINAIEKAQAEIDAAEIQSTLAQIQTDIQWIKYNMQR